jgi:hypothetical protein
MFDKKGTVYGGVNTALPLNSLETDGNEGTPDVGVSCGVTDMFTLDAGYIQRLWVNTPTFLKDMDFGNSSSELFAGVVADVPPLPSLYFTYDYKWKEVVIEGRIPYTYDLAQFVLSGFAVGSGEKVGSDKADNPYDLGAKRWKALFSDNYLSEEQTKRIGVGKWYWF